MALVVHAGDRLLTDVAALREAHGALDDAGLAGQVLRRSCRRRSAGARARCARPRPPRRRPARRPRRAARCAAARGRSRRTSRSTPTSVRPRTAVAGQLRRTACSAAGGGRRGVRRAATASPRARADHATGPRARRCGRRSRPGGRSCTSSARAATASSALGLGVEPQLLRAARSTRMSARMRALRVQQRRVAALAGLERQHVVGDLALEVLGRVRAASRRACRAPERSSRPAPSVQRRGSRARARTLSRGRHAPNGSAGAGVPFARAAGRRPSSGSSTRCRATGPTSSSTCGSPTRAATWRRR